MEIKNLNSILNNVELDEAVGIKHAVVCKGKDWGYHIAEVVTEVTAHVHREGDEFYHILSGNGEMRIGDVTFEGDKVTSVSWQKPVPVQAGDTFNIESGIAHSLKNTGNQPLKLLFVCPHTHLTTDRVLTTQRTKHLIH